MTLKRLNWDSDHFGIEIYQLDPFAFSAIEAAREAGACLLLRRVEAASWEINPMIDTGFQMADDMAVMSKVLNVNAHWHGTTRRLQPQDGAGLLKGAFPGCRFETIPALRERGGACGVYEHYLGPFGRVIQRNGATIAMSAWSTLTNEIASLDLLVVGEADRGEGLGMVLLQDTLREMAAVGYAFAEAATWLNEPAPLTVYRKAGFKMRERLQTWWLEL